MSLPLVGSLFGSNDDDDGCDGGHLFSEWKSAHFLRVVHGGGDVIVEKKKRRKCQMSNCDERQYKWSHFAGPLSQVEFEEAVTELEETEE